MVFSRAFWIVTGIDPSSTKADLISMITSEGFTSRGHLIVQAPHDVQYQGIDSATALWNCFFLISIRMLKGVFPASGQLPVHFPHCMHVNTLVWVWLIILFTPLYLHWSLYNAICIPRGKTIKLNIFNRMSIPFFHCVYNYDTSGSFQYILRTVESSWTNHLFQLL